MQSKNNANHIPQVNEGELNQEKEKFFDEFCMVAGEYSKSPFKYFEGIMELIGRIYGSGFKSGYRQSELDKLMKNSE